MRFRQEKLGTVSVLKRRLPPLFSFALAVMVGLTSSFTFSTAFDMARRMFSAGTQTVSGVWQGQLQDVPAVTIKLEQNGNELSFTNIRATTDGLKAVGETKELPLRNVRFDGRTLLFEVSNDREGAAEIVAEMEMIFTDETMAELRRTGGKPAGTPESSAMVITMRRERSF